MNKRVLFFFPANPSDPGGGHITRVQGLLRYFHTRGITVDYIYSEDYWGRPWSEKEIAGLKSSGLIRNLFSVRSKPAVRDLYSYLFGYKIPKLAGKYLRNEVLPEYATPYSRRAFNEIINKHTYDYVIISYAYWANFVKNNDAVGKAKLIIDTHDFLASQEHGRRGIDAGLLFGNEISRLSLFHEVWTVSVEEQYLFRQFCKRTVRLIPVFLPSVPVSTAQKQTDIVYVAGDNPHNRAAAKWFFSDVWPKLGAGTSISVVGKIAAYVPDGEYISKVSRAISLEAYYNDAKIAVCPMLSGTGLKVKVVEALAYGLPVVCSPAGVDGLINKTGNGCLIGQTAAGFAGHIQHLLSDTEQYGMYARQAKEFFSANYTDEVVYHSLDEAFDGDRAGGGI